MVKMTVEQCSVEMLLESCKNLNVPALCSLLAVKKVLKISDYMQQYLAIVSGSFYFETEDC